MAKPGRARLSNLAPRLSTLDTRTAQPPKKVAAPIYNSAGWRDLMARLIAQRGRQCEACHRTGTRIFGDHIRELQDGGAALDPHNVRLLCGSCHTAKTARARAARMRAQAIPPPASTLTPPAATPAAPAALPRAASRRPDPTPPGGSGSLGRGEGG